MIKVLEREMLSTLAKFYEVKLEITKKNPMKLHGWYDLRNNTIYIPETLKCDTSQYLSVFFHEAGHHHCVKNGLWKNYHNPSVKLSIRKKTALKAERWVDKWAEKQFYSFFPKEYFHFYASYKEKEQIAKFKAWFSKLF